jgi:RNA polymerase sigma-70 factor (ECF subfamily)
MATRAIDNEALRRGDEDAVVQLFEENRPRLLALAGRMTSSMADAEDVVQEAFVSTLRHHAQFAGASRPSTWLYRVAVNAALMHLRTRRRKGAESFDALPDEQQERLLARATDDEQAPENNAVRASVKAAVDDALSTLKPVDRRIVRLRLCEGMTTEEVSEALGLSSTAVKTRLHRARATLRAHIEADARCA